MLTTYGPFLTGAVVGATVNRSETRKLGDKVRADLRRRAGRARLARRLASLVAALRERGRRLDTNQYGAGRRRRPPARTPPGHVPAHEHVRPHICLWSEQPAPPRLVDGPHVADRVGRQRRPSCAQAGLVHADARRAVPPHPEDEQDCQGDADGDRQPPSGVQTR